MDICTKGAIKAFIKTCNDGWLEGWHERNGGNLTYRMTSDEVMECRASFYPQAGEWRDLGLNLPNLSHEFFITTGSGKYFRNIMQNPQENIGIIEINADGSAYRTVWGLLNGGMPTSELPTHLLNHSVRKDVTGGANRVIYHAHTTSLIALTYILPLTPRDFSRALWKSATECPVVFPEGVGVVPWMVPGGVDIAKATAGMMWEFTAAVWAHHGLFCSGTDLDTAFGLMHTIEKAADIYMRVLSSGQEIRQTITDENLREIASAFGVSLNENFLS